MTTRRTYIVNYSEKHLKVCAFYENIAVEIKFDEKYNEWAVGYAPRDGWWATKAEAIEAAISIINNK